MNHMVCQIKPPVHPEKETSWVKDFFLILFGSMLFAHLLTCDVPVNDVSEGGKSICPDPNKKAEIDYQQIDFSTLDGTTNLQNHDGQAS